MNVEQARALNGSIRALTQGHRARAAELLSELGLHPGQEFLLMALRAKGPQAQRRLAEEIDCEPPTITHMVRKLEAAGHLVRRPSGTDRRATIVELTPQGRALLDRLDGLWVQLAEETVAGVTSPAPDRIAALLQDLAGNVRRASRDGQAAPHAVRRDPA